VVSSRYRVKGKGRNVRALKFLATLCLLVAGLAWVSIHWYLPRWADEPRSLESPVVVQLEKGMRLPEFAQRLAEEHLLSESLRFRVWVKFHRDYSRFQAGQYRFEGVVRPREVADTIEAGKTWEPLALQFVVPEGFTLKQVIERLVARNVGTREALQAIAQDPELLRSYGIRGKNLEGYLAPATYTFASMPSPREVFEKMLETFFRAIPSDFTERLSQRRIDLHQAVIFASLIERETQIDDERSMVSEVIWNRLKDGEPLAIDAALIYGIEDYKGDITWEHLRDAKNLYNNRIHKGLPPTPIGAISIESLQAVLTPTQQGYRFYVLRTDGSKRHHFTKTLAEHNVYVKQLIDSSR
jgi:UPF0755 protein